MDDYAKGTAVPEERAQFKALLLQNPNYFGNLADSEFAAIKPIKGDTSFEQLVCIGLNPAYDRLEGVIEIKRDGGYGGAICADGTLEYVRWFVDLYGNGTWQDVGVCDVRVHDIPGDKPLCYAVYRDFTPYKQFCRRENIVKVRAIMQWNAPPPPDPDYTPVWGNSVDVQVQIQPRFFVPFGDLVDEIVELGPTDVPDPIGPIVQALNPSTKLYATEVLPLSLADKKELYAGQDVPLHRFAFPEVQRLLKLSDANAKVGAGKSALGGLGLDQVEIDEFWGGVSKTDGDTSFEELRCIGLRPESGLLEGVVSVKQPSGFSGPLCGKGSTEYVAFWIDFGDGAGFDYMGTTTVNVHDLRAVARKGQVHYAVFLKQDLSKFEIPCENGPRVVRMRAILSWETPPPPGDPDYVPTWGNREECLVQLNPGGLQGHIPLIETVGDIGIDDIDQATGLATGNGQIGSFSVSESPFGGVVTLTGRIGDPPDSFGGGAAPYKYRIEVFGPPPFDSWQPLTNPVAVKVTEWYAGIPQQCAPGEVVCDRVLTPIDDGDGFGPGWYTYLEDLKGVKQRFLIVDKLASWVTNNQMEGVWEIRMIAKDPASPMLLPGVQTVRVRIDNTPPSGPAGPNASFAQNVASPPLQITGATFNGTTVPAIDCGKGSGAPGIDVVKVRARKQS